jgi:hypothetical protein
LLQNVCGNDSFIIRDDAARIHQSEARPVPIRFTVDSIASDARLVADNRTPLANQAIEQRRLADVGPANDGYERQS